ncbi:Calcium-transporting ATPase [Geobacillus sp. BCO2]|nr:Calcium-transporting ATPase [Geobacillus sp. BCO2]
MTENMMTVTQVWAGGRTFAVSGVGLETRGEFSERGRTIDPNRVPELARLLTMGVLCNGSELKEENGRRYIDGDPTEGALLVAAAKAGITKRSLLGEYAIEREFPFDSERKMMTVIIRGRDGRRFVVTKGAPDVLLERADRLEWNGREQMLTPAWKEAIEKAIRQMASSALRTIAVAYRPLAETERIKSEKEAETKLRFLGVAGMIDPPRLR